MVSYGAGGVDESSPGDVLLAVVAGRDLCAARRGLIMDTPPPGPWSIMIILNMSSIPARGVLSRGEGGAMMWNSILQSRKISSWKLRLCCRGWEDTLDTSNLTR